MALRSFKIIALLMMLKLAKAAPVDETGQSGKLVADTQELEKDLNTAASNAYPDRYSGWSRSPSGYGGSYGGVTGYGTVDDRYNYGGIGSYDNSNGYNTYDNGYQGYGGYSGSTGYGGYSGGSGYSGNRGGYSGGSYGNSGNGGYGGYSGNGGLNSYYGYNTPYYQGANHLGYGYYKRTGTAGNIYNNGITPNLVTGYRGYSRK